MHLGVEAVELIRAIEAEQGDAGLDGKQDVFEVHGLGALVEFVRRVTGLLAGESRCAFFLEGGNAFVAVAGAGQHGEGMALEAQAAGEVGVHGLE